MTADTATPERTEPETLAPVAPGERIVTLDVLRGIALFGVLAANIWIWFSGIIFRFPAYNAEVWSFSPRQHRVPVHRVLISGKAITTFSFLFGLGFSVQIQRAEARGRSIVRHHGRRLAILHAPPPDHHLGLRARRHGHGDHLGLHSIPPEQAMAPSA